MQYFTYYWAREQFLANRERFELTGETDSLDYTGGSGLRARGLSVGDVLYVVNWHEGELNILGRMTVGRLLDRAEAKAALGGIFDADEHVVSEPGTATFIVFDAYMTGEDDGDIDEVQFIDPNGATSGVKRGRSGAIEPQSFRNVREITAGTAELFDNCLGFDADAEFAAGQPVTRLMDCQFTIRDRSGRETLALVDVPCTSRLLMPRWIDDDVAVDTQPGDLNSLTRLLWDRFGALCDELGAQPQVDYEEFAASVVVD